MLRDDGSAADLKLKNCLVALLAESMTSCGTPWPVGQWDRPSRAGLREHG